MRIAEPNPPYCSSCHVSWPEFKHVDFDTVYDGPVVGGDPEAGIPGTPIDDLVLCERCLRDAGALVGLVPEGDGEARAIQLEAELADANLENGRLARYVASLRRALDEKPEVVPSPRGRLPKPENVPDLTVAA